MPEPVLHVSVTQEDIAEGIRGHSEMCPIAHAVSRVRPGMEWVDVIGTCMTLAPSYDTPWLNVTIYDLPSVATRFIQLFDAGSEVDPIEFDATLREPDLER